MYIQTEDGKKRDEEGKCIWSVYLYFNFYYVAWL